MRNYGHFDHKQSLKGYIEVSSLVKWSADFHGFWMITHERLHKFKMVGVKVTITKKMKNGFFSIP